MNLRRWMSLPTLALLATACADSPVAPGTPDLDGDARVLSTHTYTPGNGAQNSTHGYWAPELDATMVGNTDELCATWIDFSNFEPDAPKLYSFEFEVDEDGEWVEFGDAGGNGSGPRACLDADLLEPGTYTVRVKGNAVIPTGGQPAHSTHHTDYWEGEITVGLLRFEGLIRENASQDFANSADFNANGGTWNFEFMLRVWSSATDDFIDVTECSEFPWDEIATTVTWEGTEIGALEFREPECADSNDDPELEHALYKVQLANPDSGAEGAGTIVFVFNGVENENDVTFTSTKPGGNGGSKNK